MPSRNSDPADEPFRTVFQFVRRISPTCPPCGQHYLLRVELCQSSPAYRLAFDTPAVGAAMSSNSKTSVSKAQSEQHKRILSQLLKLEGNRRCCDCFARGPTWASVNLGVFVCLNCSGIHRSLGTHLSKVRSTTLDTWLPEQVEFISKLGNLRANAYWEARLPSGFRRPAEGDMSGLKVFITDKYQNQVCYAACTSGALASSQYTSLLVLHAM